MLAASLQPIPTVVQQHAEDSAILRNTRSVLVRAPHVKLLHLARLDERIAAHLDGLAVACDFGASLCDAALETPGAGEVFAAAVGAITCKDRGRVDKLFALAGADTQARRGLISAFGWVSAYDLQGTVAELLASPEPIRREVGIATCVMHRVDPGAALAKALDDPDAWLRARALRAVGEAGRRDLVYACLARLLDEDTTVRFWAAASSLLLGNREGAVATLGALAAQPGPCRAHALGLWLKAVDLPSGHRALQSIARDPEQQRLLIWGAGVCAQSQYVPWLIGLMADGPPRRRGILHDYRTRSRRARSGSQATRGIRVRPVRQSRRPRRGPGPG